MPALPSNQSGALRPRPVTGSSCCPAPSLPLTARLTVIHPSRQPPCTRPRISAHTGRGTHWAWSRVPHPAHPASCAGIAPRITAHTGRGTLDMEPGNPSSTPGFMNKYRPRITHWAWNRASHPDHCTHWAWNRASHPDHCTPWIWSRVSHPAHPASCPAIDRGLVGMEPGIMKRSWITHRTGQCPQHTGLRAGHHRAGRLFIMTGTAIRRLPVASHSFPGLGSTFTAGSVREAVMGGEDDRMRALYPG